MSRNNAIRLRTRAILAVLLAVVFQVMASAQVRSHPVGKDEVVRLLKGDVTPKRVAEIARERGIDFQVTLEVEKELRATGADDALLSVLREVAPRPAAPAVVAATEPSSAVPVTATLVVDGPPGAQVYLDNVPSGTTSPEGTLELPKIQPGPHKLRLFLEGYKDEEQDVELISGKTRSVSLKLEPAPRIFAAYHMSNFGGHIGKLSISSESVSWTESGKKAIADDNFQVKCSNIRDYGPARMHHGAHIRLKVDSKERNYNFVVFKSYVLNGKAKVALEDPTTLVEALSVACPR